MAEEAHGRCAARTGHGLSRLAGAPNAAGSRAVAGSQGVAGNRDAAGSLVEGRSCSPTIPPRWRKMSSERRSTLVDTSSSRSWPPSARPARVSPRAARSSLAGVEVAPARALLQLLIDHVRAPIK